MTETILLMLNAVYFLSLGRSVNDNSHITLKSEFMIFSLFSMKSLSEFMIFPPCLYEELLRVEKYVNQITPSSNQYQVIYRGCHTHGPW